MRFKLCALITAFFLLSSSVQAAMTSTNFEIRFDSLNSGGTDNSTSTNYGMYDTLGEQGTGYATSTNYSLHAGYRQADDFRPTLSFSLGVQENAIQTIYSNFSDLGLTVNVSSTAGFAIGSYIGVIENIGLTQYVAVGKITAINSPTITVDKWDGEASLMTIMPAGSNDFAFRMDGHAADFGLLTPNQPKTSSARTEISTNAPNGYSLKLQADSYLKVDPTTHIIDVQDGAVSTGSEEYGAQVYGLKAMGTGTDFAVSSTQREIQKSLTIATNDRVAMVYKINILPNSPAGTYGQTVLYLLTANF